MVKVSLADRIIDINFRDARFGSFFERWKTDGGKSELCITTNEQTIAPERIWKNQDDFYPESSAILRQIAEWLPLRNSFVLHSAVFDVGGTGIAFAAHSGTGKTTHLLLWKKLLGDRLQIINGDKPIIRFFDGEPDTPYAYGTPWNGKEGLGSAERTRLRHLCFIERAGENSCTEISANDIVDRIFNQVYMPHDPAAAANTLGLINRLLSSVRLWKICCNMDISAAKTAYNAILGNERKNQDEA